MSKKELDYYLRLEYDIVVHKEEMDDEIWYIAYCKELGKLSCYGKGVSISEAISSFEKEKSDFIKYLFEQGKDIPEPNSAGEITQKYSGFFNVRTSSLIHAQLVEQSSELDISMNLYINQILSAAIEKKGSENQMVELLKQLHSKLDDHHFEVTKQLKYQNAVVLDHYTWHAKYQEGHHTAYMEVA
ncbi:MAG: toxin-antitoxin system HicB family antitoxin [Lentimicrobium sp.]